MRVIQVILGQKPDHILDCINSVIAYANRVGATYTQVTEIDLNPQYVFDSGDYEYMRAFADHVKLDYLDSEQDTLVCDWDITISQSWDFTKTIPHKYICPYKAMIFNNGNPNIFKQMKCYMPQYPNIEQHSLCSAIKSWQFDNQTKIATFPEGVYHLGNSWRGDRWV